MNVIVSPLSISSRLNERILNPSLFAGPHPKQIEFEHGSLALTFPFHVSTYIGRSLSFGVKNTNFKNNLTSGFKDPEILHQLEGYLDVWKEEVKASKKPSTKVSNQLPRSRRVKVEKALEKRKSLGSLKSKKKPKTHRFARTRTKPGEMRTIRFPLLETSMGASGLFE